MVDKNAIITDIISKLENNIVKFKYLKKDGTERIASGTLMREILEEYNAVPKNIRAENPNVISYFDTDINSWRSFKIDNFISLI